MCISTPINYLNLTSEIFFFSLFTRFSYIYLYCSLMDLISLSDFQLQNLLQGLFDFFLNQTKQYQSATKLILMLLPTKLCFHTNELIKIYLFFFICK